MYRLILKSTKEQIDRIDSVSLTQAKHFFLQRKQLKEARKGLNALIPYVDWDGYSKKMGYQANSTEDILLNSKNLNKHHRDCANQLNPPTRSNDLLSR